MQKLYANSVFLFIYFPVCLFQSFAKRPCLCIKENKQQCIQVSILLKLIHYVFNLSIHLSIYPYSVFLAIYLPINQQKLVLPGFARNNRKNIDLIYAFKRTLM